MPYNARFEPNGVLVRWSGHMTSQELLDYMKELQNHERFGQIRYELHDFRPCQSVRFDKADTDFVAALDYAGSNANHGTIMHIAVVAQNPAVEEAVRAYTEPALSPYPIRLFPDLEAAREWLQSCTGNPVALNGFPATS